jgi:uncharacterized protein with PIN domain
MNAPLHTLFVADNMLGKLARYLRIMGYDTVYQKSYGQGRLSELVEEGRVLLTRNSKIAAVHSRTIFVDRDLVRDQLEVVDRSVKLTRDRRKWFTRCLVCNDPLASVSGEAAREHVPDYVCSKYPEKIRFCPSCGRYYWPGTHRERMVERLMSWGF